MRFKNAAAAPTGAAVKRLLPLVTAALLMPVAGLVVPDAPLLQPVLAAGPMFVLARWTREAWPPLAIVAVVPGLVQWFLVASAYPQFVATWYPGGATGAALATLGQVLFVGGAAYWGARRRPVGVRSIERRDGALALAAAAGGSAWGFFTLSPFVAPVLVAVALFILSRRTREPWLRLAVAGLVPATAGIIVSALRWASDIPPELVEPVELAQARQRVVVAILVVEYLALGLAAAWLGARGRRRPT